MNTIIKKLFILISTIALISTAQANTTAVTSATADATTPNFISIDTTSSMIPSAPKVSSKSYILIDANSNQILAEKNANEILPPASLTKVMTMYIAENAIKNHQISLDEQVFISQHAWEAEGARMFVKQGSRVKLSDIINGIVVASGNDATVALAEHIAGSEESFAEIMNKAANKLGMKNSHFMNATGLPHKEHYSTAQDLAILAAAVIKEQPETLPIYKQKWIKYNNIKQPNRNRMLWANPKVDGMKTGHTEDAGYCLIASASQEDMRLINVQLGAPSDAARTTNTQAILNWGMRFFKTKLLQRSETKYSSIRVAGGVNNYSDFGTKEDLYITIPQDQEKNITVSADSGELIKAPISKNTNYGNITVKINDHIITTKPMIALQDNPLGGWWKQSKDSVAIFWQHIFA
jgi:serine-type D-Ala-D-Ala carboxypeptidase (penicillin-binding protein 5/6)